MSFSHMDKDHPKNESRWSVYIHSGQNLTPCEEIIFSHPIQKKIKIEGVWGWGGVGKRGKEKKKNELATTKWLIICHYKIATEKGWVIFFGKSTSKYFGLLQ